MFYNTPIEQFQILSLASIRILKFDFTITNFLLANLLALACFKGFIFFNSLYGNYMPETLYYFVPNSWQRLIEYISEFIVQIILDVIVNNGKIYFPLISVLFNFILFSNLIGLIPYSFTVTSHLIITFTLSFSILIGINITAVKKKKTRFFSLFLPENSAFFLALLLVPIEFISYAARPISLGVRLFINLMAGHCLLKVIGGFSWDLLKLENLISICLILPWIMLVLLFGLELGVALIQAYVFIILICIYIQSES